MLSKRWRDAVHEAGHTVSWMSSGGSIDYCMVDDTEDSETELIAVRPPEMTGELGECWQELHDLVLASRETWDSCPVRELDPPKHGSLHRWVVKWLDFLLSGNAAESLFVGTADDSDDGPSDLAKMNWLLDVSKNLLTAQEKMNWSNAIATTLKVNQHLPVLRLATAHYEHGNLNGQDCKAAACIE